MPIILLPGYPPLLCSSSIERVIIGPAVLYLLGGRFKTAASPSSADRAAAVIARVSSTSTGLFYVLITRRHVCAWFIFSGRPD